MWFVICAVVVILLYVVVSRANRGSFVDERDGQKYRTVKIGGQVWMAQNLNYETEGSWCYSNDEFNGKKYGRLYTWEAAKAACPAGWHLPTSEEWDELISAIGGSDNGGKKLKARKGWRSWGKEDWDYNSGNGKDKYGFSALPGGAREVGGRFGEEGYVGYWWTASAIDDFSAYGRRMFNEYVNVTDDELLKDHGFSVRCVRDDNWQETKAESRQSAVATSENSKPIKRLDKKRISTVTSVIMVALCLFVAVLILIFFGGRSKGKTGAVESMVSQNDRIGANNERTNLETAISTRPLTENDLLGLSNQQLRILRNTIFARHGRKFASADLQAYFGAKDWYRPQYDEVTHLLSAIEKENVRFIQTFENPPLVVKTVKVKKSITCPARDYPNGYHEPSRTGSQSGEYPQISGLSDTRFQERINSDIKKQVEKFLTNDNCSDEAYSGFSVLQNDGEIFAVQLSMGYIDRRGSHENKMITIDVLNNQIIADRFSKNRHLLYPRSKVTMTVSAINRAISEYNGGKLANCNVLLSNDKDGTFVLVDGNVAVEVFEYCCPSCAEGGVYVVPLYKAGSGIPNSSMFTDRRDGKTYKTVEIGGKTWMGWNLNYQTDSSWCYNNDNSNCDKYGRLYAWNAARGACPPGWHLPSRREWDDLAAAVGGSSVAGKKLKAKKGWGNNGNGTDDYGFLALSGGNRRNDGLFENIGAYGFWWTVTINGGYDAYNRRMGNNSNYVVEYSNGKSNGYSVRCVQGNDETVKTDIGTNFSHNGGVKPPKRRQNMFWHIFIMVAVVVFAVITAKFAIPPYLEKVRRRESETKKDAERAINAVEGVRKEFNDLVSTMKNAAAEYVSAKARGLSEEATAIVNKLAEPIEDAVALCAEITAVRSKKRLAAFEKSEALSEQAEKTAKRLEKEVGAAKDLYGQAAEEEEIARKEEAAEKGDATAKYDVCKWYLDEKNNLERFVYWLRKSAEQGYAAAQLELGTMYFEEKAPLERDINEALVWLEKAAGKDGLPPMTKEVADWFRLNCDSGDMDFVALLRSAVRSGRKDVMEWLFSLCSDIDVNNEDDNGFSLLHNAAFSGNIDVMKLLIEHGANVEAKDAIGKTPIFILALLGHIEAMKWLANERGASVETRDNNGRTPIFSAADKGQVESIRCLKEDLGASILVRDSAGLSPMDYAAGCGRIETIKCLAQLGANVNAKNANGQTPMFDAAAAGKAEVIRCLADLGADVNAVDNDGTTPMFKAAQAGQPETIICLKELGADINACDSVGMTPIFMAAGSGKPANIERLVSLGVEVNTKAKNGMTPIFLAAAEGQLESVKRLVSLGADVNVEAQSMTPLELAEDGGHTDVEEYLRANGAR